MIEASWKMLCWIVPDEGSGEGTIAEFYVEGRDEDEVTVKMEKVVIVEAGKCLKTIKMGKTPRQDGLPTEFCQRFWDLIGQDLTEVFKEVLQEGNGCPPKSGTESLCN